MNLRVSYLLMFAFVIISSGRAQETVTNPPAPAAKTFQVTHYDVRGNTVLAPEQVAAVFTNHLGDALTVADLKKGLGELQLLYRNYGYATIYVSLPQQKITNGVVRVDVVEGRLNTIKVEGNKWYSTKNVLRSLPSLETNVLLNTKWFQTELDLANGNSDRQIYPVLQPGVEPDTTELTLRIKDRFPIHWHTEVDNKSTPGTPTLRIDSAVQYNNLWQLEHQVGVQYNFSPQGMKYDTYFPNFLDQPKVATYSAFYRIPLGFFAGGLREDYERLPANFGYDPVARRFNLPAATGKPEFTVYASRSSSETAVVPGPIGIVTTSPGEDILQQFFERDLTVNEDVGGKLAIPVKQFAGVISSFSVGADLKRYTSQSYSTNNYFVNAYETDTNGIRLRPNQPDSSILIPTDGTLTKSSVVYVPVSFGWAASRPDKNGNTTFGINQNLYLEKLSSGRQRVQAVAGSTQAGGDTVTVNVNASREQNLPRDWSVLARVNGQWASAPVIGNEQFGVGGSGGVRGYPEGAEYGDSGWRLLTDLRAPPWEIGAFPRPDGDDLPAYLRCSLFMDGGSVYRTGRPGIDHPSVYQWGTGFGAFFSAGPHVEARLTMGCALLKTPTSDVGDINAYFSVGIQY